MNLILYPFERMIVSTNKGVHRPDKEFIVVSHTLIQPNNTEFYGKFSTLLPALPRGGFASAP